jgi:hypothetical protein
MIFLRIVGLAVATGFCGSASLALRRRLGLERGSAGLLVFLLFFTTVQSLLLLAAGMTGTLSAAPLTLIGGAGWALLQLRRPRLIVQLRRPGTPSEWILAGLAALALGSLLVKAFLLEPYFGDAIQYHLPKIAESVQAGRFVWGINHDPRLWFSAGFDLIETWWVLFLRHDALIELGGIQMALLAAVAVVSLAETLGARPGFAGVVYLFIPAVLLQATACGNDLAVGALVLSAYALVAAGAPRPLQALPLLLAVGIKATGAFAAVGVVAFALSRERPPRMARIEAAALTGVGLLLAGVWYLRNWIVAGHPLFPVYGSHGEFAMAPQQGSVDLESLQATIQVLPGRLLDRGPFQALSRNAACWGWAAFALGLPALLLALREDRQFRILALSFGLGACATFACIWPDDATIRYIVWFPALLALCVARLKSAPWVAAALLACVVNFTATLAPYEVRYARHLTAPATLPPTAPVACVFIQAGSSYFLYGHDFGRRVFYPRSMEDLRRSGAKYVWLEETPSWAIPIKSWRSFGRKFYEVP